MAEDQLAQRTPPTEASLEDALARLDEIITRMEEGNLPLDDLLKDYEEGAKLVQLCQERLKAAEKRIMIVTKSLDGSLGLADFDPGAETSA
jgi:exodeoxyribonuclease VII small subunit